MSQMPVAALIRAVQLENHVMLTGVVCAASIIGLSHFASADPVAWPLRKSANNTHLVDRNNQPFFIKWSI